MSSVAAGAGAAPAGSRHVADVLARIDALGRQELERLLCAAETTVGAIGVDGNGRALIHASMTLEQACSLGWSMDAEARIASLLERTAERARSRLEGLDRRVSEAGRGLRPWQRAERARRQEAVRREAEREGAEARAILHDAMRLARMTPPGADERARRRWAFAATTPAAVDALCRGVARAQVDGVRLLLARLADGVGDTALSRQIERAPAGALAAASEKARLLVAAGRRWPSVLETAHLTDRSELATLRAELEPASAPRPERRGSLADALSR